MKIESRTADSLSVTQAPTCIARPHRLTANAPAGHFIRTMEPRDEFSSEPPPNPTRGPAPPPEPDEFDGEEDEDNGELETTWVQKLLSPLYIIILLAFLVAACVPFWFLLTMLLTGLQSGSQ